MTVVSYVVYGGFLATILGAFCAIAFSVAQMGSDARWTQRRQTIEAERANRGPEIAAWTAHRADTDSLYQRLLRADRQLLAELGVYLADGDAA